ncbi:unnamed protein product [Auanema sp. JU1783]|nr:unnamed protein product [Auanema sp. JU1783]
MNLHLLSLVFFIIVKVTRINSLPPNHFQSQEAQTDSHESLQQTTQSTKDQPELVDILSTEPIVDVTESIQQTTEAIQSDPTEATTESSQIEDSTHKLNDDLLTQTGGTESKEEEKDNTCVDITIPHPLICQHSKDFCKRKGYESLMKQKCPKTCGYCSSTTNITRNVMVPTEKCVDLLLNLKDGTPGCLRYKKLCKHRKAGEYVRLQCPLTCGLCVPKEQQPKSCYDEPYVYGRTTCQQLESRCDLDEVKAKCPDMCGMCPQQKDIVCMDKLKTCDAKNCDQTNLRLYMTDICPVTCGYCNASTGEFF